jgi:tRNA (cmo5U34)-methyltransferase
VDTVDTGHVHRHNAGEHQAGAPPQWSEDNSEHFIRLGEIYAPSRAETLDTILGLTPATERDEFTAVELGVGAGWLSEAILEKFPRARIIGLDGSERMLEETGRRLERFPGRFDLREFRLEDDDWLVAIPRDIRVFVSSLVIHHLDGESKRRLYVRLFDHLEPGGALLIADLVRPLTEIAGQQAARAYDELVKAQSIAATGTLEAYQYFVDTEWNWFEFADPMDMPSSIPDHLRCLQEAGFYGADVFWLRAGHAVFGGFKPEE